MSDQLRDLALRLGLPEGSDAETVLQSVSGLVQQRQELVAILRQVGLLNVVFSHTGIIITSGVGGGYLESLEGITVLEKALLNFQQAVIIPNKMRLLNEKEKKEDGGN